MEQTGRLDRHGIEAGAIDIARVSHRTFAAVLIGLGVIGLIKGDFAPGWQPVPESIPARQALVYLCAFICLACGVGLFLRSTAALASRVLFAYLLLWLLLLRVPWMFVSFGVNTWWAASSTAVITTGSWLVYSSLAGEWDRQHFGFLIGSRGLPIARMLFGLALIPFGLAHFLYLDATAPVVPAWLPWHVFWAYFTGSTFIAAGIAVLIGIYARLAACLATLQIGLFTLLIWVPLALAGCLSAFQWNEFVVSIVLAASAWVVADSYRVTPWFAVVRNTQQERA